MKVNFFEEPTIVKEEEIYMGMHLYRRIIGFQVGIHVDAILIFGVIVPHYEQVL
jgi:hypothetical protein